MSRYALNTSESKGDIASTEPRISSDEAERDELVASMAKILNQCLEMMDELGMSHAATHLSAAIEKLPGQMASPPIDLWDLLI